MTSVPDILRKRAEKFPELIAIKIADDEEISYRNLNLLSSKIANFLLDNGLKKHDKVSVALSNAEGIFFCASYFGIQKAGGVFVPVNLRYSKEELLKQLVHSDSSFFFVSDESLFNAGDIDIKWLKTFKLSEIKKIIINYRDTDPMLPVMGHEPAEIIYTSGTTGISKGIVSTHGSLTAFDDAVWLPITSGKTFLNPVPLYTFAGITYMLTPLRLAMKMILMPKFDPHYFVELLEKEKVSSAYAVSSMWLLVLKEVDDLKNRDFSNLSFVQFGAAPMPPSAVLELCNIFPNANIINLYGLTEAGSTGCMMPPGAAKSHPGSVGIPLPPTEVKIIDEHGNMLSSGEIGEILLRGESSQRRSYYKDKASTDQVWINDGWVRTGDLGYLDKDGYLYLVDRKKDIIIRGGYNISSLEVEDALFQHPDIKEAAVVGIPHPVLTEDVVAYIVLKEGKEISEETLRNFLLKRLADYKVPRRYVILDQLPKNALGKILKRELRTYGQ